MKLNLNINLKGLDGQEAGAETGKPMNLGKLVAALLVNSTKVAPEYIIKYNEWAPKFFKGTVVELDKADTAHLKKFVETHPSLSVLMIGQILEQFDKAKP